MPLQQKLNVDQVVEAIALMNQADIQELRRRLPPVLSKYRALHEPTEEARSGLWQQIKDQLAENTPDLLEMSPEARKAQFDRLSEKIASELSYESMEAFEQAMRGDTYGLARH
ncbi:MAG TPA: hypothetical protein VL334_14705 [Anaerolineae bacterium]|nr:hypothetical protein [Anaerolineae bacterium]